MNSNLLKRSLMLAASCLAMGSASAGTVDWTDWQTIGGAGASGVMGGVNVTATVTSGSINGPTSQTGCGTNYWTGSAYTNGTVSNAPTNCEQVSLNSPVSITVTFSSAIDTLYMGLLSVGQPNLAVTYDFDQSWVVDSEGAGFFGNDATNGITGAGVLGGGSLTMREFHGVLRFDSPVTSLRFTTNPSENWHAFTFGMAIPEPGSLALVGAALLGVGAASRRRKAA